MIVQGKEVRIGSLIKLIKLGKHSYEEDIKYDSIYMIESMKKQVYGVLFSFTDNCWKETAKNKNSFVMYEHEEEFEVVSF